MIVTMATDERQFGTRTTGGSQDDGAQQVSDVNPYFCIRMPVASQQCVKHLMKCNKYKLLITTGHGSIIITA